MFIRYFFVVYVMALSVFSAQAWSDQPMLKACGHEDYPPWNWRSDDQIVGACAEVVQTLFGHLGVRVDLSYVGPWKRCQKAVEQGSVDINICAFINPEREIYSTFIDTPMGQNQNAVFVRKGAEFRFEEWSDLSGKQGALVLGVSLGGELDEFLEKNTRIERVATFHSAFKMLQRSRVDFVILGRESGQAMLASFDMESEIVPLQTSVTSGNLYISMSKKSDWRKLLPEIEQLMNAPGYSEFVERLLRKYTRKYALEQQES